MQEKIIVWEMSFMDYKKEPEAYRTWTSVGDMFGLDAVQAYRAAIQGAVIRKVKGVRRLQLVKEKLVAEEVI